MSELSDTLSRALSGDNVNRLASQVGSDPQAVSKAVSAAMPMILGGLARNALKSDQGRNALADALDRDHDGGILDNLGDLLGAAGGGGGSGLGGLLGSLGSIGGMLGGSSANVGRTLNGDGILEHALGNRRIAVEQGVSKSSGLDLSTVAKLLPMIAPLIMGALGRAKREQGLDAAGVADLLDSERQGIERNLGSSGGRSLIDLLDADDDGSVADELASIGSLLSKSGLFNRT